MSRSEPDLAETLLYLRDQGLQAARATVVASNRVLAEAEILTNRSPLFVGRGGQPSDAGTISGPGYSLAVRTAGLAPGAGVTHRGMLTGRSPRPGDIVEVAIDPALRRLHSLWHSAGEAVIVAAKMAGFDEPVLRAIHYGPNQNRITYASRLGSECAERLRLDIVSNLRQIVRADAPILVRELTDKAEVVRICGFWPDYIGRGEPIRVVQVLPGYTGRPCTGTHLGRTSELAGVAVRAVRCRGDKFTISYDCDT